MKIVYLVSSGVMPWNVTKGIDDSVFGTMVIVTDSKLRLIWCMVSALALLRRSSTKIFRWHTIGIPFSGSKVQLKKLEKDIGSDPPGFKNTYFEKSEESGIWCNSSELVDPFSENHFDYLADSNRTLLILAPPSICDTKHACRILCRNPVGYRPQQLLDLLEKYPEMAIIRFYEQETHVAADLFGRHETLEQLAKDLSAGQINNMISADSREEIVELINAA